MLPSALIFLFTIYEEDPPSHIYREPFTWHLWAHAGRLTWHGLWMWIAHLPPFPEAALPLAWVYTFFYAAFLLSLAWVMAILLGSPRRGAFASALIALHFLSLELRIWNGFFFTGAGALVLIAIGAGLRLAARPGAGRFALVCILSALLALAALNAHQVGAMTVLPIFALAFARALYKKQERSWAALRPWAALLAGFCLGCGLYGAQILITFHAWGPPTRVGQSTLGAALLRYAKVFPLWAATPLPIVGRQYPSWCLALLVVGFALLLRYPRGVSLRRRMSALAVVLAACLASYAPVLASDGYPSARNLIPSLLGLYGLAFYAILHDRARLPRAARGGAWCVFAVLLVMHTWAFAMLVTVKHTDVEWVERLHKELVAEGTAPGDRIEVYARAYQPEWVNWYGSARSVFATRWGVEFLLKPEAYRPNHGLPKDLEFVWLRDQSPPPRCVIRGHPGMVCPLDAPSTATWRTFAVDTALVAARDYEIEDRFVDPFDGKTEYPLPLLARCAAEEKTGRGYFYKTKQDDLEIGVYPGARLRLYLVALPLERPWRLRALVFHASGFARIPARAGIRTPDGRDRVLFETKLGRKKNPRERLKEEGPAMPGALLWIEAECPPEAEHPVALRWRRGRVEMQRRP